MALSDGLVEFWSYNDTRIGAIGVRELAPAVAGDNYVAGQIGNAWGINGSANRVLSLTDGTVYTGGDFSFSFWWKQASTANLANRITLQLPGASISPLQVSIGKFVTGKQPVAINVANVQAYSQQPVNKDTLWHHICASYSAATTTLHVWVDGAKISNTAVAAPGEAATGVKVGLAASIPDVAIDALGIWSRAIDDTDAAELLASWEYSTPAPPAEPKVTAMLLLMIEESSGRTTEKRIPLGVA